MQFFIKIKISKQKTKTKQNKMAVLSRISTDKRMITKYESDIFGFQILIWNQISFDTRYFYFTIPTILFQNELDMLKIKIGINSITPWLMLPKSSLNATFDSGTKLGIREFLVNQIRINLTPYFLPYDIFVVQSNLTLRNC